MNTPRFAIRPFARQDFLNVQNYWHNSTAEDFERMGVDQSKVPSRPEMQKNMEAGLKLAESEKDFFLLIWEYEGRSIGFNTLKNIVHGEQGEMHLHMWDTQMRGKNLGGTFFCLCTLDFFKRFRLKTIKCEPRSSNPLPN